MYTMPIEKQTCECKYGASKAMNAMNSMENKTELTVQTYPQQIDNRMHNTHSQLGCELCRRLERCQKCVTVLCTANNNKNEDGKTDTRSS